MEEKKEEEVQCETGECVIDLSQLAGRKKGERLTPDGGILIVLARGTYGHFDDGYSAIQAANAALAVEEDAAILLLDDGVYFGVKGQDTTGIELVNNTSFITDFLELGGRVMALKPPLDKRGLAEEDLIEGIEIVENSRCVREILDYKLSLTF